MNRPKRILLAVLNWGLGHATRCIPIVKELQIQGAELFLASDGNALKLLEVEFPELTCLKLPPYNISYDSSNMIFTIGKQMPKIMRAVANEKSAIKKMVAQYKIDIIISDNRYGCFHKKTKNIFITHQINLLIPFTPFELIARWINQKAIEKFDECWIPDFEGENNIAGILSHQHSLKHAKYIGNLSRMQKLRATKKYDVIVVLSGPEPQRSFLEKIIIKQAEALPQKFLIIRGIVTNEPTQKIQSNIELLSFMSAKKLNRAIAESDVMICRSGYSSIMDLVHLEKKAILIPTPGQTEQLYLAKRFFEMGLYCYQKQETLNLEKALMEVQKYKGFPKRKEANQILKKEIEKLLVTK